jgi:protein-S-isoprenylcysteine O-methyltransferase Ste14
MYVGVLSVLAGESLLFASRGVAVYTAVFALCVHLRVVLYEEPTLRKQFGGTYDSYCRRVHRWLPRPN